MQTNSVLKLEQVPNSSPEEAEYQKYHWDRLEFAFQLIQKIRPARALEIGPWTLAHNLVKAKINVDTMGFISDKIVGTGTHFKYDLDKIGKQGEERLTGNYDLVIAAEVIEHLYLDLDLIFMQLNDLTRIGGFVLVQTPNAAALKKRGALLFGKNPFEMIRPCYQPGSGGHIREFTMKELEDHAKTNGFEVVEKHGKNYFNYTHSKKARLYKLFCDFMPPSFRDGITIVLKKSNSHNSIQMG
jgi:Methyltransferase domain